MRILNINKLSSGTLAWSSQLEKYPFTTAFADTDLSCWGKFASNTGQYLQVSYPTATSIYYAEILNANFSANATVQLQCSDDGFSTAAATYNFTKYGIHWIYRNDAGVSHKAYRFCVSDPSITYPRLSKIYLGGYTEMPGMSEITTPIKSSAKTDKTDSGQLKGYKTVQLKQYNITFDSVNKDEHDAIDAWFEEYDKTTPCVCILYENTPERVAPLYCAITDDLEWKTSITGNEQYQLSVKLEECK